MFTYNTCHDSELLLYADDTILIGTCDSIPVMLQVAERASYDLGFRWIPTNCIVLPPQVYNIYGTPIQHLPSFQYLSVPLSSHHNLSGGP